MRTAVLLVVVAGALAACGGSEQTLQVGDPAPMFTLTDTSGTSVSLEQYADGRPVLLYFHMAVG